MASADIAAPCCTSITPQVRAICRARRALDLNVSETSNPGLSAVAHTAYGPRFSLFAPEGETMAVQQGNAGVNIAGDVPMHGGGIFVALMPHNLSGDLRTLWSQAKAGAKVAFEAEFRPSGSGSLCTLYGGTWLAARPCR